MHLSYIDCTLTQSCHDTLCIRGFPVSRAHLILTKPLLFASFACVCDALGLRIAHTQLIAVLQLIHTL